MIIIIKSYEWDYDSCEWVYVYEAVELIVSWCVNSISWFFYVWEYLRSLKVYLKSDKKIDRGSHGSLLKISRDEYVTKI